MDIVIFIVGVAIGAIGGLKIGYEIRDKSAQEELKEERAGKAGLEEELKEERAGKADLKEKLKEERGKSSKLETRAAALEKDRKRSRQLTNQAKNALDMINKKDKSDEEIMEQEAEIKRVEMDNNT